MERYYKFDKDKLEYQYISKFQVIKDHIIHILMFSLSLIGVLFFTASKGVINRYIQTEGEVVIINHNHNEFTQEKFIKEIGMKKFLNLAQKKEVLSCY